MLQTLSKWFLVLSGGLEAIISVLYLMMQGTNGPLTFHAWKGTLVFLGELTAAAGVCRIVAVILRPANGKLWLLVDGVALGALGLILTGTFGSRIQFRTVVLLLLVAAMSVGIFELVLARSLRSLGRVADARFFGVAGVASVGFAVVFFAYALRWIKLRPGTHTDLLWFGSYFGFSAIGMLALALRPRSQGLSASRGGAL